MLLNHSIYQARRLTQSKFQSFPFFLFISGVYLILPISLNFFGLLTNNKKKILFCLNSFPVYVRLFDCLLFPDHPVFLRHLFYAECSSLCPNTCSLPLQWSAPGRGSVLPNPPYRPAFRTIPNNNLQQS